MVKVEIIRNHNLISSIKVWDHAGSGDYGFDLVCAGVSAIMIGALNAFDEMDLPVELTMDPSPLIQIRWLKPHDKQKMMDIIYIQLKTIKNQYKQFIRIREKEEIQ